MELIRLAARLPELEYAFRHALIQESAYKTILLRQRRRFHGQVGEAMEMLFADILDEHASLLAYHFAEAGDTKRSIHYSTQAGDVAFRLYANTEAIAHYSRAIEMAKSEGLAIEHLTGDQLRHLYIRRGRALELNSQLDRALASYEEMLQLSHTRNDRELELAALMAVANLRSTPTAIYDFAIGKSLSEQAIQLAQALEDKAAEAKILWSMLNLYRFTPGRTQEAMECGERSLEIARALNHREQMAFTLNDLAHIYNRLGRYDKSTEALGAANELWRELDNRPMLADNLATASYVHVFGGGFDQALAFSDESFAISQSTHNTWGMSYSRWEIGLVYRARGEYRARDPNHAGDYPARRTSRVRGCTSVYAGRSRPPIRQLRCV